MSHLESHDGWLAVMHDLCRWTSKERQDELAENERRIALEALQISRRSYPPAQWNMIRSSSRRGVVRGVQDRKDFSWASVEASERYYGADKEFLENYASWILRRSETAGE